MADHLDVPGLIDVDGHLIGSPGMDPRIDITDLYAFQKPGDATKSILILNVSPLHGLLGASAFNPDAIYEILVDNDGDAFPNVAFKTKFSPVAGDGSQTATVVRAEGPHALGRNFNGDVLFSSVPVSFGSTPTVSTSGSYKYFAGKRSDPFFFDLLGFFKNPIAFTGSNFFAPFNVLGTALEVPNSSLGSNNNVGAWARVLIPQDGDFLQIDRMGRPAINTVFMKGKDKVKFNRAQPNTDVARFTDNVVKVLVSLGHTPTSAATLAAILLPDILTYNYNSSAGFLNGRNLTDDVIDAELSLVTNGGVTSDGAGPRGDTLSVFPYLGTPL